VIGEHTRLINMVVGICDKQKGWPSFMHEQGYEVKSLERVLTTKDGGKAKPDVIIVSNKNKHVILVECKSGSEIKHKQDKKYDELEVKSIISEIKAGKFIDKHVVAYAINDINHDKIKKQTNRPTIVFAESRIWGRGEFGVKRLNEIIHKGVSLNGMKAPTKYYPFGLDDNEFVVISYIIQSVVRLIIEKKTVINLNDEDSVDVLFDTIYELRRILPSRHIKEIKNRIKQTVDKITLNKKLMSHMDEARKQDSLKTRTKLVEVCNTYLKESAPQKNLKDFI